MKIIDLNVKIEYDPEKDEIVNYSTTLNGIVEKKTSTTKLKSSKGLPNGDEQMILVREENKLILSKKLVEELGAQYEDRISINYERNNGNIFPVIGVDASFGAKGNGNKLTKSNTIACRGNANTVLAEFGSTFNLESYKEGIFKLIGDNKTEKAETPEAVIKKVDMGIEVTGDTNYNIEDLDFNL